MADGQPAAGAARPGAEAAASAMPRAYPSGRETRTIVLGIMLALAMSALDQTIVVTALPSIAAEMGGADKLSWAVTAYLLTATATAPLYGRFADIRGRQTALYTAIAVFAAGSVASALAPNMTALVVARALQGLGAGGLVVVPLTIIGDIVPPKERGRYQAYFAVVFATASVAGPLVGGILSEAAHWSLIFWINLPLAAAAAALLSRSALKTLPDRRTPRRLDVAGAVLLVSATTSTLVALTYTGPREGYLVPATLGLLAAGLGLLALLVRLLHRTPEPLIPPSVLRNPVVACAVPAAFFTMGTFTGLTVVVPLHLEVFRGLSPSQSGIGVIPLMIGTTIGATVAGQLIARVGHYKRIPVVGLAWAAVVLALVAAGGERLPEWALCAALGLVSLGIGTVLPVTTVAVQNAVAPEEMGTATAAVTFSRQLGGAFLAAIFGAFLMAGGAAAVLAGHGGDAGAAAGDIAQLQDAYRWIFAAGAASLAGALLLVLRMEERPLATRPDLPPE